MKKIIKSRLDEHMVDLYHRVDNLKKDISIIKCEAMSIPKSFVTI